MSISNLKQFEKLVAITIDGRIRQRLRTFLEKRGHVFEHDKEFLDFVEKRITAVQRIITDGGAQIYSYILDSDILLFRVLIITDISYGSDSVSIVNTVEFV